MLPEETRTKIVTLRNYTNLTFDQIADKCGCSVSVKLQTRYEIVKKMKRQKKRT